MPVELNYKSYGEGRPFYILHGLFGSHRNWSAIARELCSSFRVVTIDLRNHGNSGHADTMRYLEMADDIKNLAGTLEHGSISILGHSMGGKTAMALALLYPSLVERLIVVDIAPVRYHSNHEELILAMQKLPVSSLHSRGEADKLLSEYVREPTLRAFLLQNLVRDQGGFKWRINLDAIQHNQVSLRDFPKELGNMTFSGETLFLSGELSDYIRPQHQEVITRIFPNATHHVIENANHWVHADQPGQVLKEVQRFLG